MSLMHNQINRTISTGIAERVIQRFKTFLVQCHLQETGTLRQVCSPEVRKTGKIHLG